MSKRKKIFILSIMVLVLGIAAVLNFVLLNNDADEDAGGVDAAAQGFFTAYRTIRQEERNEEVLYLDSIIGLADEEFTAARVAAAEQKLKLVEVMETELLLEQLLRARGYGDAIVSMSVLNDSISVIIKGEEVTRSDTAIIYSVIKAETGAVPQAVTILATA